MRQIDYRAIQSWAWALVLVVTGVGQVGAHQKKEALTKVLLNPRTGNIEVMHRFASHDVEHALRQFTGQSTDLLLTTASQQQFAEYVAGQFALAFTSADGGRPVTIELAEVGYELEGSFLWLYFEAPTPSHLATLIVEQPALQELWPTQVNLVNIEREGRVRGLLFAKGAGPQETSLP